MKGWKHAQRKACAEMGLPHPLAASRPGEALRTLRFLPGPHGPAAGCRLEDEAQRTLYEAVRVKRAPFRDMTFEFRDTAAGSSLPHLVSRTFVRKVRAGSRSGNEGDAGFVNRSGFYWDGTEVWDFLRTQGIRIRTAIDGETVTYGIFRDGMKIAEVQTAPLRGRKEYAVRTRDGNMEALFLILFSMFRTESVIYDL